LLYQIYTHTSGNRSCRGDVATLLPTTYIQAK